MPPEDPSDPKPEPTPEPAPDPKLEPKPDPTPDPDAGAKKALDAERKARADAEKTAKAATAELEKLRKASMSEQEKAVTEAEERGRKEATTANATKLAAAKIEAALTGVVPDPASLVEELNLTRYIGDDGEIDSEAIAKLKEKYAALAAPTGKPVVPGVPSGVRPGDPGVKQLSQSDMKGMSASEIVQARKNGQFNDLMAGKS